MKIAISFVIGLLIGVFCRWFDVPVPAPPKLIGALLVLSITVGYLGADWLLQTPEAETAQLSGGPTGDTAEQ